MRESKHSDKKRTESSGRDACNRWGCVRAGACREGEGMRISAIRPGTWGTRAPETDLSRLGVISDAGGRVHVRVRAERGNGES